MGEGADGMRNAPSDLPSDEKAMEPDPSDLEKQIEDLRAESGRSFTSSIRRRHDALDVRLQLRRHAPAIAVVGVSLALIVSGRVWMVRRRRALQPLARGANLARVLAILSKEDPSQVDQAIRRPGHAGTLVGAIVKILPTLIRHSGRSAHA